MQKMYMYCKHKRLHSKIVIHNISYFKNNISAFQSLNIFYVKIAEFWFLFRAKLNILWTFLHAQLFLLFIYSATDLVLINSNFHILYTIIINDIVLFFISLNRPTITCFHNTTNCFFRVLTIQACTGTIF